MTNQLNFSHQLIKGRIAEMIFEQMLREADCFTVLRFGYENILPELMHRQHDMKSEQTMEIIRRAPDFAVINNETHDVHLIEIKYRRHLLSEDVLKIAERMLESWKPSYLFIATREKFYFGKVSEIVKDKGGIKVFEHKDIPLALQEKYLSLLRTFIKSSDNEEEVV